MPVIQVVNRENQPVGKLDLSEAVFAAKVEKHVLWEAVQSHLANKRRGTASTKTRADVSGGGIKPWKQKGTGRARAGSNRSPLWYKGGVVFGPHPRDFSWELPKQIRRQAMRGALTAKFSDGSLVVLDELALDQAKTKLMAQVLKNLNLKGRTTLVLDKANETVRRSGQNLKALHVLNPQNVNTYSILNCDHLLMTKAAVSWIEENLSK